MLQQFRHRRHFLHRRRLPSSEQETGKNGHGDSAAHRLIPVPAPRREEWQQDQDRVLQDLGQKMMAVIDKYAKDNGFSLILDVSNPQTPVLYASNTIDVTKDIVDLYDKNAPTSAPGAAARPAGGAGATGAGPAPAGTNVAPQRQAVPVRPPATAPVKK